MTSSELFLVTENKQGGDQGQGAQQTIFEIHWKYDLNEAIMEKSRCI